MQHARTRLAPIVLAFTFAGSLCSAALSQDADAAPGRVSEFGKYEGYSQARFKQWVTTSRYIEMRDGVKLAMDVTRPAIDRKAVDEPLPVVWTHSRYHRNPTALGGAGARQVSMVDAMADLQRLIHHGYVVVTVGVRGSGASFGRCEGLFTESETLDAIEIIEWLAAQPWCDGKVGMFGGSYLGITQYMAASKAPPALKAIFPNVAAFDMYEIIHPGGVFREDLVRHWDGLTKQLDTEWDAPLVDGDDGSLMQQARAEHANNWETLTEYRAARYRDHDTPSLAYDKHGPSAFVDQIVEAQIPAYHFNAWYDVFVLDATLWYANYTGPQKLAIGAWSHGGMANMKLMFERARLTAVEQHRWFDYWLKGIDNGIMDEPPIHYADMVDPANWEWHSAETWPIAQAKSTRYYFSAGPSGSIDSTNDGVLSDSAPTANEALDEYNVDLSTTTGTTSRWDNAVGAAREMIYPDLAPNGRKSLTYTTPVLESDLTITGHPVVTLYVTSTNEDALFHVLLEEVSANGASRYVTEGVLRGSMRALDEAPWNNLGLPYQRCFKEDRTPLPADEPTKIVMDLHPTSTIFNAGNRIRVTIMCADADNTEAPPSDAGTIHVYRGRQNPSSILLPVVE